jgi:hypothetical protein
MQPALVALALAACAAVCEAQGASQSVRGLASPSHSGHASPIGAPSRAPTLGPSVLTTTTGRDAGVLVHSWPCQDGHSGPFCLPNCPSGFRDDGSYCFKPKPYGRGVGTVMDIKTSCSYWPHTKVIKSCKTTSSCGSKDTCLGLCYNSCRDGYYAIGCNICSPRCPPGMTDIGVSCKKR